MLCAQILEVYVIETETRIVRNSRRLWVVQQRIVGGPGEWIDISAPKISRADAESFRESL